VNAEFNLWLLIVGLVAGAGLVWLVLADSNRREQDLLDEELPAEAAWISDAMADRGEIVDPAAVERILRLHRDYLAVPPPDEPDPEAEAAARAAARRRAPDRLSAGATASGATASDAVVESGAPESRSVRSRSSGSASSGEPSSGTPAP
jgi:hypothetical protein